MAYARQNITDDMVLEAEHINKMQDAIIELYGLVSKLQVYTEVKDNSLVVTQPLITEEVQR